MSTVVENRVVELQFDNKEFEKNVQESLKSLQKLREELKMEEAVQHLKSIDDVASHLDFSALTNKINEIGYHFTAIGRIADNVFGRVTNAALNAGTSMAKSLTVDQVSSGMSKYEQQVKAIQTISSATGMSVAQIQPYIEELMKYSDDTSYSFTNMISSLGKFLNAGRSIEESVTAIKGISNEAAHAGAGIEEANRAMYNFSQALSMGYVQKIDWKSIENANMATQSFKNELIKAGKELGTLDKKGRVAVKGQKKIEVTANNLSETLSKQWLTADVLMRALEEYGNVETDIGKAAFKAAKETKTFTEMIEYLKDSISSGWLLTFEAIIGDYEQATQLWSGVADELGTVFGEMAEKRNLIMNMWEGHGGRFALIEALQNIWELAKDIAAAAGKGWSKVFPDSFVLKAKDLVHTTNDFRNFTATIKEAFNPNTTEGAARLEKITTLFEGLGRVAHGITTIFERMTAVVTGEAGKTMDPALDLAAVIGTFLNDLGKSMEDGKVLTTLADGFNQLFTFVTTYAPQAVEWLRTTYEELKKWAKDSGLEEDISNAIAIVSESFAKNGPEMMKNAGKVVDFIKEVAASTDFKALYQNILTYLKPVTSFIEEFGKILSLAFNTSMNVDVSGITDPIEKLKAKLEPFSMLMGTWFDLKLEQADSLIAVKFPILHDIIEAIQTLYAELEKLAGGSIPKFIGDKFTQFTTAISDIWTKIQAVTTDVKSTTSQKVTGVFGIIFDLFSKVGDFANNINDQFSEIKEGAKNTVEGAKTGVTGTIKSIVDAFNNVVTWLTENINWDNIKEVGGWVTQTGLLWNTGGFIGSLSGVMKSVKTRIKGNSGFNIGDTVLKLAGSFALIVGAIYAISIMDESAIEKGRNVLIAVGLGLVAFAFLINKVSSGGNGIAGLGEGIFKAAAGILLMWLAIKLFKDMEPAVMVKSLFLIGLILAEMALFSRLAGKGGNNTDFGSLALGINMLLGVVQSFAKMDWGSIGKGIIGLGLLLLELGLFVRLGLKNGNSSAKAVVSMLAMAVAINMMIPAIQTLAKMKGKDLIKSLLTIGALLVGMGAYMKLAGGTNVASSFVSMIVMAGSMYILIEAVKALANTGIDATTMKKFSDGLAEMLIGFGVAIKLMGHGGWLGGVQAAVNLVSFVGIMAVALAGFGYLNDTFPDLKKFINEGGELLNGVGNAVGQFIHGLITGVFGEVSIDNFMTDLNKMGDGLNSFADKMKNFKSKSIEEAVKAMTKLGQAAAEIPPSGGLIQMVLGEHNINTFGTDLVTLGTGINSFAQSVKEINTKSVDAASNSLTILAKMSQEIPTTGSVIEWLLGKKDLSAFATDLPLLGRGLRRFDLAIKNLDANTVTAAANSAEVLASLSKKLPYSPGEDGSVLSWLMGTQSLGYFGQSLPEFGKGLNDFYAEIKDISPDSIDKVGNASMILAKLSTQIPYSPGDDGSVLSWLMGKQDLGYFGQSLPEFGAGLSDFATSIKDLDTDAVTKAANAADILVKLGHKVPADGGLIQALMGDTTLGTFGNNIAELGDGLAKFGSNTEDIKTSGTDAAIQVLDKLINSANQLTAVGGYAGMITSLFGSNQLDVIGSNLNKLAIQMSTINVVQTSMAFDLLAKLGQVLTAFSSKEVRENAKNAKAALRTLTQDDEFMNLMKIMATTMTGGIIDALQNESKDDSNTSTAAKLVGEKIVTVINSYDGDAYNAGTNLMLGLRNGILEHAGYASDAMAEAMSGATGAGEKVAEIASPSKVTTRMGRFLDEGLALGIRDFASLPETEARSMMDGVITASQEAAAMMEYLLNTDPTLTPTITPVFDMRSVREGAGYLNGTISSLNGLRFGGISTGNIAADVIANNDAGGVIAALNQINGQLVEMEEAITNMQVVLDGKALVGHIESDVDRRLGMRAIREERRG